MIQLRRSAALAAVTILCLSLPVAAKNDSTGDDAPETRMTPGTFSGLELRGIGPALMSGRIADIAIHPDDQSVWYVGVGSGGVWKTTNAGTTWSSIFDGQGSYSIGVVAIDPSRPSTVWVGTGENVDGRHVGYGDGVYKSLDGGQSWTNMGLDESEHIGSIVIDPRDSDVAYVAAKGPLWSKGGDRGLFKTTDGGETWTNILGPSEWTGVNEVMMDPRDPDVLFAATHQRHRTVAALINGGPESGIHKSTDGGATWRELTKGLPSDDMGRIGLAISPHDPDVMYATIELAHREGGFYRSEDGGESWTKRNDYISGGTGPHYYQEIFASPHAFDRVYQMDARLRVTHDGGATFERVNEQFKHGDSHAMAFDPEDPDYLLVGSDGGLYESFDLADSWKYVANLPITQFYKVAVDYDEPFYNVYGGTQDNNTQGGPSRTDDLSGIRNADWFITLFGDGHQPAVDPTNPDIVYSEWQQGNLVRYDRRTGEFLYIKPQPEPGDPAERHNWDSPILISSHDPARLYFASQRVWRSDDRGDSWRPISGDLSRGLDRLKMPMMERVWSFDAVWDLWAMSAFANVTSLGESPLDENLLYAGTDDGLLHVTEDGGETWRPTGALPGVPTYAFVNDVKADLHDVDTVYVALDNHKEGDYRPMLLKSTDRGATWTSIVGDLPERHLVWRVVQDHEDPDLLFAATEFGIFFTIDGGGRWVQLSGGAPTISFRDLAIQRRENDLVGASFGRGFWVLDDYSPLREVTDELLDQPAHLFPVRDAWWYIQRNTLGVDEPGGKASQGHGYFTAPNPPFGAVFTFYLEEALTTRKERRREAEKENQESGGDNPYPGWDEMEVEAREEAPSIVFTVRDAAGNVVRRLTGSNAAGFQRVAWDLRYPTTAPVTTGDAHSDPEDEAGFLAAPGTYSVTVSQRSDGLLTDIAGPASFEVKPMRSGTLKGAPPSERAEFMKQLAEAYRVTGGVEETLSAAETRVAAIKRALVLSSVDGDDLGVRAREIEATLAELREMLDGERLKDDMGEPAIPGINGRLSVAFLGNYWSSYGPTPTHHRSLEIALEQLGDLKPALSRAAEVELVELEAALDAAGVPWTPSRGVPAD